jgi:endonuclease V-like protein UPF0215 family
MQIRKVKKEIRILGVDDARFIRGRDSWTRLIGVVYRGGEWMEGCIQAPIQVDGDDVTEKLIQMVQTSSHFGQLRVIMTRDTIFGGVNVLNINFVTEATGLPVIAVSDSKPDMIRVTKALKRISPNSWKEKLTVLEGCGPIKAVKIPSKQTPLYLQWAGIPFDQVRQLVRMSATRSGLPEPVRVAHLIASSFVPNPSD